MKYVNPSQDKLLSLPWWRRTNIVSFPQVAGSCPWKWFCTGGHAIWKIACAFMIEGSPHLLPFLRDHSPVLPLIQCLEIVVPYLWSSFSIVYREIVKSHFSRMKANLNLFLKTRPTGFDYELDAGCGKKRTPRMTSSFWPEDFPRWSRG